MIQCFLVNGVLTNASITRPAHLAGCCSHLDVAAVWFRAGICVAANHRDRPALDATTVPAPPVSHPVARNLLQFLIAPGFPHRTVVPTLQAAAPILAPRFPVGLALAAHRNRRSGILGFVAVVAGSVVLARLVPAGFAVP